MHVAVIAVWLFGFDENSMNSHGPFQPPHHNIVNFYSDAASLVPTYSQALLVNQST